MMRLVSQGRDFDGLPDDPVVGTFGVADYGRVAKPVGGYTNKFSVKITPNNQAIIEHAELVYSAGRKPYQLLPIEVWVGQGKGMQLLVGSAIVEEAGEFYNIAILEGNSNWFEAIKNIKINELDLRAIFEGSLTQVEVAEKRLTNEGLFYPAVEYGMTLDDPLSDLTGAGLSNQEAVIDTKHLRPAIQIKSLIKEIEKVIGWTFIGLEDFPDYEELCFPFTNGEFKRSEKYINDHRIRLKYARDFWATDAPDPLSLDPTGTYMGEAFSYRNGDDRIYFKDPAEAQDFVWYEVQARIRALEITGTPNASFPIRFGGSAVVAGYMEFITEGVHEVTAHIKLPIFQTNPTLAGYINIPQLIGIGGDALISSADSFIEIRPIEQIGEGNGVNATNGHFVANDALPQLSATDVLNWLAARYGLVFTTNTRKKQIKCTSLKSIINNKTRARDWSGKLDETNKPVIKFRLDGYGQNNIFRQAGTGGVLEKLIINREGSFTISNEQLPFEEVVFESKFRLFEHVQSFQGERRLPFIPMYPDPEGDPDKVEPVICRAIISSQDNVFAPFQSPQLFPNYDQAASLITIGLTMEEILADYWTEFIAVLQNIKVVECYLRLNVVDILNLDFTIPVYIDEFKSTFLVQEVHQFKFNKSDRVKVTLIRI